MYICLINLILITLFQSSCRENICRSDKHPTVETSKEEVLRTTYLQKEYQEFKIEYSLKEISGLAVSSINKGSIYLHEDSGNEARIYVVSSKARREANLNLRTVKIKTGKTLL